eukprot:TRINITY_DN5551_c0_g1_i1.p1 TRINITY_DN5551_c0_g1~~TRINITY_DN5551_c0_g1_i1.p1  ORF type:complete len:481 (+),score=81.17 TRINITY_DN5551_c0_g1_i1:450-1892(+)
MLTSVLVASWALAGVEVIDVGGQHPEPPTQDQCVDVNATLPSECPATIGPPCPPCYTNTAAEYSPGDSLEFSPDEVEAMSTFHDYYINWWAENLPPTTVSNGYDVFSGSAGRGLIHLRSYYNQGSTNSSLLTIAKEYVMEAIKLLPEKQKYSSYFYGHVGVWFLASKVDSDNKDKYLTLIKQSYQEMVDAIANNQNQTADGVSTLDCTLDTGLSGMLYGALLFNNKSSEPVISPTTISVLIKRIISIGISSGTSPDILEYESFPNCYLYGPGHGSSGAIKTLFTAWGMGYKWEPHYTPIIKNTINYYISLQLSDWNIPTNLAGGCGAVYGTDADARVQWCHGAPGFITIFLEAAQLFNNATYSTIGLQVADVAWSRGLLVKGTMFCHGIIGNVNMFHEAGFMLSKTMPQESLKMFYRAKQMTLWTLNWSNINKTRITASNEPYSMFQGNYAAPPMMYSAAMQKGWPLKVPVCQPGWNICI